MINQIFGDYMKELETERLLLRKFRLDDADAMFYGYANDSEVTKYLTWNPHKDINETKELLSLWVSQYQKPERINYAIILKNCNKLIGGIDVCGYKDGVPVIGYVLSKKYWNMGLMTEAFKELIKYLNLLGHKKILVDACVDNIGSNKVILKCGGSFLKVIEDYFPSKKQYFKINTYEINIDIPE